MIKKIHRSGKLACLQLITMLLLSNSSFAQRAKGIITGTVVTADNQPLAFATVMLKDTRYGTMAKEDGRFKFDAPAGNYTLIITYAGYITTQQSITVTSGQENNVRQITVKSAANQLREVVVADIQKNKFAKKPTTTPAKIPLADLENPQVYSMVTKEIMQEQLAVDFNTAVASVPGVVASNGVNDSGNDFTLRGFRSNATFRNGLVVDPRTQTEIVNIERVEVLKGPSATLYGGVMATYGGVINTITKRPFESFRGEVSYTTGSWGLNRFTADINTPLNKDRTALIRINTAAHTANSFQDAGFVRSLAFAASMSFKTSERTTVRFDADVYAPYKNLNAYVRSSDKLTVTSMKDLNLIHNRSFSSNDIGTKRSSVYAMAEIEHKISDQWISKTSYQHGESGENQSVFLVLSYVDDTHISRGIRPFDVYQLTTDNLQQNFIGDFKIGNVRNRLVAGLDYYGHVTNYQYGTFQTGTNPVTGNPVYSVFAPYDNVVLDDKTPWNPISRNQVDKLTRAFTTGIRNTYFTLSAYASDAVNITDYLVAVASLRVDRYENKKTLTNGVAGTDNYTQVQYSPKFGLVFQPIKNKVSLFGNYSNGFINVAPSVNAATGTISVWDPQQAYQTEGGIKLELFDGKLNSTLSYYDIKVKDMVRSLPDGTSVQDGTQKSKGFEAELIANPVTGLNLVLGYGYNDNKYTQYNAAYQDKRMPWTPENVFNAWASYKFLEGKVKGIGVGAGVNYAGKTYMEISNKFGVPAYTIFGATAFYDQPKYRIGIKVNNFTNEQYWNFYGQPQNPREVLGSISYKF
ncbi:TonB-dependent receptor (plasmid) [Pedobacter sp. BS3]|uniref:TonB-dependent receptor n=1 Tax=Pedobacter sp. BS3 TaxID=2567937 RepID=UPI0011ECE5DC|nr:TonB-dependent receptor [Pedobacter sp. BS3]TZF85756.1 TonB-dependent receptor [Pedobacter sp. BS3]